MKKNLCLALILIMASSPISERQWSIFRGLIIWDVGQGLAVSLVTHTRCLHFDLGGQYIDLISLARLCRYKDNAIALSHNDYDHWRFAKQLMSKIKARPCALNQTAQRKLHLLRCPQKPWNAHYTLIYEGPGDSGNSASDVFLIGRHWLHPGDSTKREERIWSQSPKLKDVTHIILGHHGSNTSTGVPLLSMLPRLHTAIVSAKEQVYGHPHPKVMARLRYFGVSVLTTEDWGTVVFQSP